MMMLILSVLLNLQIQTPSPYWLLQNPDAWYWISEEARIKVLPN